MDPKESWERELERIRPLLLLMARQNMHPRLWKDVDPSGVVQETLLEAHRCHDQFLGSGTAPLEGWVRRILLNNLYDALRRVHRDRRDVHREVALDAALDESTGGLRSQLAAGEPSPSQRAIQQEHVLALARALERLETSQRETVELYHLQGRPLSEVASLLGRSESAVAALLHRGLKRLREEMEQGEPHG